MQRKPIKTEEMIIDDLHEGVRELGALSTGSTCREKQEVTEGSASEARSSRGRIPRALTARSSRR